jgi:hypothetical protein
MSGNLCPFTVTWANSRTRPRFNRTLKPEWSPRKLNCFTYLAVPEKYLTPESLEAVHDDKEAISIWGGASKLGGNATFHVPVIVNRFFGSRHSGALARCVSVVEDYEDGFFRGEMKGQSCFVALGGITDLFNQAGVRMP